MRHFYPEKAIVKVILCSVTCHDQTNRILCGLSRSAVIILASFSLRSSVKETSPPTQLLKSLVTIPGTYKQTFSANSETVLPLDSPLSHRALLLFTYWRPVSKKDFDLEDDCFCSLSRGNFRIVHSARNSRRRPIKQNGGRSNWKAIARSKCSNQVG